MSDKKTTRGRRKKYFIDNVIYFFVYNNQTDSVLIHIKV